MKMDTAQKVLKVSMINFGCNFLIVKLESLNPKTFLMKQKCVDTFEQKKYTLRD